MTRTGVTGACLDRRACGHRGRAPARGRPASASPYVHAHRGGSLETGQGRCSGRSTPENSMPAFRAAARRGFVLELDVKLSADRRPVVIHDATLDRTTDCEGRVDSLTLAQLRKDCEIDLLGTERSRAPARAEGRPAHDDPDAAPGARRSPGSGRGGQRRDQEPPDRPRLRPGLGLRPDGRRRGQGERDPAEPGDLPELLPVQPERDRGRSLLRSRRDVLPDPEEHRGRRARRRGRRRVRLGLAPVAASPTATSTRPTRSACGSFPTRSTPPPTSGRRRRPASTR